MLGSPGRFRQGTLGGQGRDKELRSVLVTDRISGDRRRSGQYLFSREVVDGVDRAWVEYLFESTHKVSVRRSLHPCIGRTN